MTLNDFPELKLSLQQQELFLKQLSLKEPTREDVQNSTFFASLEGFESEVSQETWQVWYYHASLKKALKDNLSKHNHLKSSCLFNGIVELTALIALRNIVIYAYGFNFWNNTFIKETQAFFRQNFNNPEIEETIANLLRSLGKKKLQSHWEKLSLDPSCEESNVFLRILSLLPSVYAQVLKMENIRCTIRQSQLGQNADTDAPAKEDDLPESEDDFLYGDFG